MASNYDTTEFVDTDFQTHKTTPSPPYVGVTSASTSLPPRAPTREEVDLKVTEAQQKLAELKRAQEELERERAGLEELRRRQAEFQKGREEMVHNLTRGLGLLEEAEFTARRDAEQMAKTLADFRDALDKIESIQEEHWSKDAFNVELTRALTTIENARMEWNSAKLRFGILTGQVKESDPAAAPPAPALGLADLSLPQLCKLGLAFTWPLATVAALGLGALIFVLMRQ